MYIMVGILEMNNQENQELILSKKIDGNCKIDNSEDAEPNDIILISSESSDKNVEGEVTQESTILENVKNLLNELITNVENGDIDEENSEDIKQKKGILKHERTYSNKHVDFDLALQYIPYDPEKDYTIEIQFVETIKEKVVSYAALFAAQKKLAEETLANNETSTQDTTTSTATIKCD